MSLGGRKLDQWITIWRASHHATSNPNLKIGLEGKYQYKSHVSCTSGKWMVYLHQVLHRTFMLPQSIPNISKDHSMCCSSFFHFNASFRSQTRLATSTLAPVGAAGARWHRPSSPFQGGQRTAARAAARIAEATEDGKFRGGSGLKGLKKPGFSLRTFGPFGEKYHEIPPEK